ncbi:MAG: iron ABC transporter permease, partial [Sphaerochaetaceae bacterium]
LFNSIKLGLIVGCLSTMIGYLFAFAINRTTMPGKKFFHILAMMPILSPPFVISLAVILLFGRSGVITKQMFGISDTNVYGFPSLVFVQTLAMFPLAYLNLKGVMESMDSSVENAARSLGAGRLKTFLSVTLPLSLPGILSAFLIVFAKSLSDFGNPQVLAGDYAVLSVSAYTQITGLYNLRTGSFMAASILVPSLLAFFIQKYWVSKKSFVTITGKPVGQVDYINEKKIVRPIHAICLLLAVVILLFYGTVLWVSLVKTWGVDMSLSLKNYKFVFQSGSGKKALVDTLILSIIATPITALLGMGISYLLVRKKFAGKRFMEFASMVPFAVPGIALGIGYVIGFNQKPLLLTGTALIIIAALVFRTLSVGVEAGSNSLRQVDKSIEEASTILGANNFTTFTRVSLPIMKSALFSGLLNAFVRSMTSVSAVIFIVSVRWNLLTVSIMSAIESNKLGLASAYCVLLMCIVLIAMVLLEVLVNKAFGRKRENHDA